jgi:hypothetical protein
MNSSVHVPVSKKAVDYLRINDVLTTSNHNSRQEMFEVHRTLGTPKPTLPPVALILSLGSNFSPESKSRKCRNSLILAINIEYV